MTEQDNPQDREQLAREFEQQANEKPPSLVAEFWYFLAHEKKWWLIPIIVIVLLLGAIVFLGSTGAGAFIYTLF